MDIEFQFCFLDRQGRPQQMRTRYDNPEFEPRMTINGLHDWLEQSEFRLRSGDDHNDT